MQIYSVTVLTKHAWINDTSIMLNLDINFAISQCSCLFDAFIPGRLSCSVRRDFSAILSLLDQLENCEIMQSDLVILQDCL